MPQQAIIPLAIILPLLAFYLWMFRHMLNNDKLMSSPWMFFGIMTPDSSLSNFRYQWTIAFVFMNVFAAALYYFSEYRNSY